MNTRNEYSQPPADAIEVEEPEYRPTWAFLILVWGALGLFGAVQGAMAGKIIQLFTSMFGQ